MRDEAAAAVLDGVREHTDEALALEFARRHARLVRYVDGWSKWMLYDGAVWAADETLMVFSHARALCRDDAAAAPAKERARILSAKTVAATITLARSDPALAAVVDQWDADPMALNCDGEVVQLDADGGFHRSAIAGDYFTRSTAVQPGGDCPLWLEFLELVTGGDGDLIDYLQRMCGYCLTGLTVEHALFFLWGPGGNGKSTFIDTITGVMGDYAKTAGIDTFTAAAFDRHPTDIADLGRTTRLCRGNFAGQALGRDAHQDAHRRRSRQGAIHAPGLLRILAAVQIADRRQQQAEPSPVDDAFRRRFHMIPFIVRIPDDQRILGFSDRLREECRRAIAARGHQCSAVISGSIQARRPHRGEVLHGRREEAESPGDPGEWRRRAGFLAIVLPKHGHGRQEGTLRPQAAVWQGDDRRRAAKTPLRQARSTSARGVAATVGAGSKRIMPKTKPERPGLS